MRLCLSFYIDLKSGFQFDRAMVVLYCDLLKPAFYKDFIELCTDDIRSKVYIIRGQQVMMDKDLAEIYGYDVKRLDEQVKRNINRFPEDFMFQLKASEITDSLKSQFATLNVSENKRAIPSIWG